jgi:hypothetical protein
LKATFTLDVELVARVNAVALLRGQSRDAIATAALEEACKGLVMWERAKPSRRSGGKDRLAVVDGVNPDAEENAA